MTTVATKAKADINNATTNARVITLLEKAIQDIDACKVTTIYYDNSDDKGTILSLTSAPTIVSPILV